MFEATHRVNIRHIQEVVEQDFMYILNAYKKTFGFLFAVSLMSRNKSVQRIIFEDPSIHNEFKNAFGLVNNIGSIHLATENFFNRLVGLEKDIFSDFSLYIDEIVENLFKEHFVNIVSITINRFCELETTFKHMVVRSK